MRFSGSNDSARNYNQLIERSARSMAKTWRFVWASIWPSSMFRCVPLILFFANAFVILLAILGLIAFKRVLPDLIQLRIDLPAPTRAVAWMCGTETTAIVATYLPILLVGAAFLLVRRFKDRVVVLAILLTLNSSIASLTYVALALPAFKQRVMIRK